VVEAVAAGRFAVYAVTNVDDALTLMTGLEAGDPSRPSVDTVNGRIAHRLAEYARLRRGEASHIRQHPTPADSRAAAPKTGDGAA
jgi:hypothetical protein